MCMDCKGEYFERDLGCWYLCVYGRGGGGGGVGRGIRNGEVKFHPIQ